MCCIPADLAYTSHCLASSNRLNMESGPVRSKTFPTTPYASSLFFSASFLNLTPTQQLILALEALLSWIQAHTNPSHVQAQIESYLLYKAFSLCILYTLKNVLPPQNPFMGCVTHLAHMTLSFK